MKSKTIFLSLVILLSLKGYAQEPEIAKVDIALLTGDQPKLLSSMASSLTTKETLNGSKINIGTMIGGWHAQAVAQYKDYVYVAFSTGDRTGGKIPGKSGTEPSQLWIYNTKTQEGELKELAQGYPHPCSIQITGKYLTMAVEAEYGTSNLALGTKRAERSMVLIYDLEQDPKCSVEVSRVVQDGMNSGGAGLTYNPQTKCWFLLVDQHYADKKVVIYKTADQNINTWQKEPIAKYPRFGAGAGLNLITATDNSIWGLWYDVNRDLPGLSKLELSGDDVYLFKVLEPNGTPVDQRIIYSQVVTLSSPKIKGVGELLGNSPGMRFGATLRNEGGKLELITCQRNMDNKFNIGRSQIEIGNRSEVMFVNFSRSKAEIKCASVSNPTQKASTQSLPLESWNQVLQSPVKGDLNYLPVSTQNLRSLSTPKWVDAAEYQANAPLVLFYMEGTDAISGKMQEFYAVKSSDARMK